MLDGDRARQRRQQGQPVVAQGEVDESGAEIPPTAKKPIMPWLVRKPARKRSAPATSQSKSTAPVSTAPTAPKPDPEKTASADSAIDALRKARERAHKRTDKDR